MDNPLVSVIITTHNYLDFLKRAIDSVKNQTYKNIEIIVVDDCSTDGTQKWLKTQEGLKLVLRDKNFGNHAQPKNDGIRASTGAYIAYLDADNTYLPDHIQGLVSEIVRSGADVVYGDRLVHSVEGDFEDTIGVHSDYNGPLLLQQNYIDTSDTLMRRETIYEIGGWDERYGKYADWNLNVRLAKAGKTFKRVPKILTIYNIHKNMKSLTVETKNDNRKQGINKPDWDAIELEIVQGYLREVTPPRVACFTLTKDRLEYTKHCFATMKDRSGYEYDHFIVDNGSADGTVEWLENEYKPRKLIKNEVNKGISIASNQALDEIGNEYDLVLKVDNDCEFITEEWLSQIVDIYKKNHCVVMSPYPEGLRDNVGGPPRTSYGKIAGHLVGMVQHVGGLCHVAPARVYKDFRWDESSVLHGIQDLELSMWLSKRGYTQFYIEDIRVNHYEGTGGQEERYPSYFELRKHEKTHRPQD